MENRLPTVEELPQRLTAKFTLPAWGVRLIMRRQGYDTLQLAKIYGVTEAQVYNVLAEPEK